MCTIGSNFPIPDACNDMTKNTVYFSSAMNISLLWPGTQHFQRAPLCKILGLWHNTFTIRGKKNPKRRNVNKF